MPEYEASRAPHVSPSAIVVIASVQLELGGLARLNASTCCGNGANKGLSATECKVRRSAARAVPTVPLMRAEPSLCLAATCIATDSCFSGSRNCADAPSTERCAIKLMRL